jgi:hypothetical protein
MNEKNDRGSLVFQNKLGNVKDALNILLDKGFITSDVYMRFIVRILELETMEELDNLVTEVAQICKAKGL